MKVVVIGTGAMGTLFGSRLARTGHDVTFIDADRERVDVINRDGVAENHEGTAAKAAMPGQVLGTVDLVIVFTKAMFTAAAIEQNLGLIGEDTSVLTLQNGLGNGEKIAALTGADKVLCGITNWPADLVGHGQIHVDGQGTVKLWSLDGTDRPSIHAVATALDDAGLSATAEPEVQRHIWEKVIFNAALNGVGALTRLTVGEIGDFAPSREIALGIVAEGIAIAHGSGVPVDGAAVEASVEFSMANHRQHKTSMLQDVEAGRLTEVDSIHGGLLDAAQAAGVKAPLLHACTSLLRSIDHANGLRRAN